MKKLAIAALAVTSFAGTALAADMRAPVYKAPPVAAPAYSWTGCYLGAGGGGGMWNQDHYNFVDATGVAFTGNQTTGGRGWFGTVQGGCDYQFAGSWVFGAFGDYDFGDIDGDLSTPITSPLLGAATVVGEESMRWSWSVGARLGWTPLERLLTYVSAGYTQAHFDRVDFVGLVGGAAGLPSGAYLPDHTYSGWFIGTGYEYHLGWFPGLTWKTEYRFANYGSDRIAYLDTATGAPIGQSIDSEKYIHTVRSQLVWRFNWAR